MLLADADASGWILVAQVVVGGVTTVAGGWFVMRTNTAKLAFDAEQLKLRAEVASLTEKVNMCHGERDGLAIQANELNARVNGLTAQNAGQQKIIDGLLEKVGRLIAELAAKGLASPGSDDHPTLPE
jgi:FtsZ-binding cell division protein ZapB